MTDKNELFKEDREEEKSSSEMYFEWWLDELKDAGFVLSYKRCDTYDLIPPFAFDVKQHYKTKEPLIKTINVLRQIRYTPDYEVVFSKKLLAKLFCQIKGRDILDNGRENVPGNIYQEVLFMSADDSSEDSITLFFDVKPPNSVIKFAGANASSRDFPIKQRLMYSVHNIFVNKVVPYGDKNCLFCKTFLPKRYKWTDKSKALRKLKDYEAKAKTLNQYLDSKFPNN